MPNFDPRPAAQELAAAYRAGELLVELRGDMRPRSLGEGYDVQDRLIDVLGLRPVGWKLGVGSIKLKAQAGIGRSIAGRVLAPQLYRPGATVELPNAAPVTVEFEIAFEIADDVRPDGPRVVARDVIADTRVAFELVLSRFVDRRAVGWPSFAADNAGFQALILGEAIDPKTLPDLLRSLRISANGEEKARAATGEDVTDPYGALDDLIAIARERRMVLPKGAIVSTGSASQPFNLSGPEFEIAAAFLGTELRFAMRTRHHPAS